MEKDEPLGYCTADEEVAFNMPSNNKNLSIKFVATHDGKHDKVLRTVIALPWFKHIEMIGLF